MKQGKLRKEPGVSIRTHVGFCLTVELICAASGATAEAWAAAAAANAPGFSAHVAAAREVITRENVPISQLANSCGRTRFLERIGGEERNERDYMAISSREKAWH